MVGARSRCGGRPAGTTIRRSRPQLAHRGARRRPGGRRAADRTARRRRRSAAVRSSPRLVGEAVGPDQHSSPGRAPAACSARSTPSRSSSAASTPTARSSSGSSVGASGARCPGPRHAGSPASRRMRNSRRAGRRGAVHQEVGELGLHRAPPAAPTRSGHRGTARARGRSMPSPVAAEQTSAAPCRSDQHRPVIRRDQVDLGQHDAAAAGRPARRRASASSRSMASRRAVDVLGARRTPRPGGSAAARARDGPGTRGPGPPPRLAPSSRPGTSATVSWRPSRGLDRARAPARSS